jgi:DNA-binding PadR family transcriptional regulator
VLLNDVVVELLPIEKSFKDIILEDLKEDPKSISKISRTLEEKGYKFHKLILTGYLRALEDFGYVKAKDYPPSKVYQTSIPHKKDIYEAVGDKVSSIPISRTDQAEVSLYILQKIYRRPIFQQELIRCGFRPEDIIAPEVKGDDRIESKVILTKAGVKLPRNDPAYWTESKFEKENNQIISDIFIESFGIKSLIREATQSKLDSLKD